MSPQKPERRVEEIVDSFDQLVTLLDRFEPAETVLSQLVHSAANVIPETASATVTVLHTGGARTLASSHDWATELDQHQYNAQDGPCLHAARTGRLVRLDTTEAGRWSDYCALAREHKVAVVVGVPLLIDDDIVDASAALNLTTTNSDAFAPLDEALLEMLTHSVSVALNHAHRHQRARELASQLGTALESRDVIGQAKGLLMAHYGCGPEEAFERLRATSQQANTKLRDLAAQLIRNGGL